jgi:L-aspartate oxidase
VHGANRLASNSLSEAIVFGRRIVKRIDALPPLEAKPKVHNEQERISAPIQAVVERRLKLQKIMVRYAGLRRNENGLKKGYEELKRQLPIFQSILTQREEFEFANLLTCALMTTEAALQREESRGAHYREDFPTRDDLVWRKHTVLHRTQGITEERIEDV